jgi:hypothetical protein
MRERNIRPKEKKYSLKKQRDNDDGFLFFGERERERDEE